MLSSVSPGQPSGTHHLVSEPSTDSAMEDAPEWARKVLRMLEEMNRRMQALTQGKREDSIAEPNHSPPPCPSGDRGYTREVDFPRKVDQIARDENEMASRNHEVAVHQQQRGATEAPTMGKQQKLPLAQAAPEPRSPLPLALSDLGDQMVVAAASCLLWHSQSQPHNKSCVDCNHIDLEALANCKKGSQSVVADPRNDVTTMVATPTDESIHFGKMKFPTFDGSEDPRVWQTEAEKCFLYYQTPKNLQVRVASLYFSKEVIPWYWNFVENHHSYPVSWEDLVQGLGLRYESRQGDSFSEPIHGRVGEDLIQTLEPCGESLRSNDFHEKFKLPTESKEVDEKCKSDYDHKVFDVISLLQLSSLIPSLSSWTNFSAVMQLDIPMNGKEDEMYNGTFGFSEGKGVEQLGVKITSGRLWLQPKLLDLLYEYSCAGRRLPIQPKPPDLLYGSSCAELLIVFYDYILFAADIGSKLVIWFSYHEWQFLLRCSVQRVGWKLHMKMLVPGVGSLNCTEIGRRSLHH